MLNLFLSVLGVWGRCAGMAFMLLFCLYSLLIVFGNFSLVQTKFSFRFHFISIFLRFSNFKSSVGRQLIRLLVCIIFINNNHASFHLWWKKKLMKYWNVSKYYDTIVIVLPLILNLSSPVGIRLQFSILAL